MPTRATTVSVWARFLISMGLLTVSAQHVDKILGFRSGEICGPGPAEQPSDRIRRHLMVSSRIRLEWPEESLDSSGVDAVDCWESAGAI
jgi:hypothetical protein